MPRYIFFAGVARISAGRASLQLELWLGIESREPIDLEEFSREHSYDLIPADGMSDDELRSVNVVRFEPWPYVPERET